MDKALKQRLVGAIVLIILAVIVLPMLLSGRSETLKQESRQIEVPPRPEELSIETRRFPVGVPNGPDVESVAPEQLTGTGKESTQAGEPLETATQTTAAAVESSTEPGRKNAELKASVENPPAVARIKLAGAGDESASVPAPVSDDAETPRYLVQVGSFSTEKRANALAQRLRGQELPVVMDVVNRAAGRLHRVRVGPYTRREDADAVVSGLRDDPDPELSELVPRVLDLRPEDSAPVTTPSDPLVRWVVQVGSFSDAEHADALVKDLRLAGLAAFSEQVTSASGTTYKVRVGPEINRDRAVELKRRLKQEHALDGFVTTSE
ncbi:MAG: SPOR domain-containing protein [Xanthomonadales bacterium]|nr:SPOR domain-containing protein [Xanthomonadales bacterium]